MLKASFVSIRFATVQQTGMPTYWASRKIADLAEGQPVFIETFLKETNFS
ncbi:hypothetical protein BSU04_33165 [Caballeronia sordidicola]|uniref:Uncharacterized protein n=1 Tax=Caballeronia sordidicola TaxID=196367 RepID=A0A226WSM0_CABSO|nr:hypothetical protein BSU04_33165 [Caballeronia sordidicola]